MMYDAGASVRKLERVYRELIFAGVNCSFDKQDNACGTS
jgi:hypothetical protein